MGERRRSRWSSCSERWGLLATELLNIPASWIPGPKSTFNLIDRRKKVCACASRELKVVDMLSLRRKGSGKFRAPFWGLYLQKQSTLAIYPTGKCLHFADIDVRTILSRNGARFQHFPSITQPSRSILVSPLDKLTFHNKLITLSTKLCLKSECKISAYKKTVITRLHAFKHNGRGHI